MSITGMFMGAFTAVVSGGGGGGGSPPTLHTSVGMQATGATPISASITTTLPNQILIAIVSVEGTSVTATPISGVSGGGLTWTKYTSQADNVNTFNVYQVQEIWWAKATSTLSAVSITAATNVTIDDATFVVAAFNGCNLTNPFDTNASLPVKVKSNTTTVALTGITTTSSNITVVASFYTGTNMSLNTLDTGFTLIQNIQNGSGQYYMYNFVEYQSFTSARSSFTVTNPKSGGRSDTAYGIAFALTG
jgi:hypothetical protein